MFAPIRCRPTPTDPTTPINPYHRPTNPPRGVQSHFRRKAEHRYLARLRKRTDAETESELIDEHITLAEDERTVLAKADLSNAQRIAADEVHQRTPRETTSPSLLQRGKNATYAIRAAAKRTAQRLIKNRPHVQFAPQVQVLSAPAPPQP